MSGVSPERIQRAIASEVGQAEPSEQLWERVREAVPMARSGGPAGGAWRRAVAGVAFLVLVSAAGTAAATDEGRNILARLFEKFGVKIETLTPEVRERLEQEGSRAQSTPVPEGEDLLERLPAGMKLPGYLPPAVAGGQVRFQEWGGHYSGAGVTWSQDGQWVGVMFHSRAFGPGSTTYGNGEIRNPQEVMINDLEGTAFQDDSGWRVDWVMDGHQYTVVTNLSLDEALTVAASIR